MQFLLVSFSLISISSAQIVQLLITCLKRKHSGGGYMQNSGRQGSGWMRAKLYTLNINYGWSRIQIILDVFGKVVDDLRKPYGNVSQGNYPESDCFSEEII